MASEYGRRYNKVESLRTHGTLSRGYRITGMEGGDGTEDPQGPRTPRKRRSAGMPSATQTQRQLEREERRIRKAQEKERRKLELMRLRYSGGMVADRAQMTAANLVPRLWGSCVVFSIGGGLLCVPVYPVWKT